MTAAAPSLTLRAGSEGLIIPEAGAATVYNYDAPNGTLVSYRVRRAALVHRRARG